MARFAATTTRLLSRRAHVVYIDGIIRRDIECIQVQKNYGLRPNSAELRVLTAFPGDDDSALDYAMVTVYLLGTSVPIIAGFAQPRAEEEGRDSMAVRFRAESVVGLLDKIYPGQETTINDSGLSTGFAQGAMLGWLRTHPQTGVTQNYTLTSIIRWLFSAAAMNANWQSLIGLGDMGAISDSAFDVDLPDITTQTMSLKGVMQQLLKLVPDVGIREAYDSTGKCTLHFFRFGRPYTYRSIAAANLSEVGPEDGAIITAYAKRTRPRDAISRLLGYGRPVEMMLTVGTDDGTAPLEPAWENATSYATPVGTVDELAVLANPAIATEGSPLFDRDKAAIFRVFRLPDCLQGFKIRGKNIATLSADSTREVPIQVFTQKYIYSDGVSPVIKTAILSTTDWELISGARIDVDRGLLVLPRPAVAMSESRKSSGQETRSYSRIHVYLTATFFWPYGYRPAYDSGVIGELNYTGIGDDPGMVMQFVNESVGFSHIGNYSGQLIDSASYGAKWYDETLAAWQTVSAGTPTIVEDDRSFLINLGARAVAERTRPTTEVRAEIPGTWTGYQIGEGLRVRNRGIDTKQLQIVGITFDLRGAKTLINATDQIPRRYTLARKAGGLLPIDARTPTPQPLNPFNIQEGILDRPMGPFSKWIDDARRRSGLG